MREVLRLISDLSWGVESNVRPPEWSRAAGSQPPHLLWERGGRHPVAVGVTPGGLEFRVGEHGATRYSDLQVSDEPGVVSGIEARVEALRESMRVVAEQRAKSPSPTEASTVDRLVAYLEAPAPRPFLDLLSPAAVWVDRRDDDEAVIAGIDRQLGGGIVSASWTGVGRLTIRGPRGEQTVAPKNRDVTLHMLVNLLGAEFELRQWIGSIHSDITALFALPTDAWREVAAVRSSGALDAEFRRIHARSKLFG